MRKPSYFDAPITCPCGEERTIEYTVSPADHSVGIMGPSVEDIRATDCPECGHYPTGAEVEAATEAALSRMEDDVSCGWVGPEHDD